MLRLRSTFLRICSGTPSTQPGLLWSNYFSKYTHISTALSNNAGQKSCRLKLSLLSTSTNIRGLKQWVIMKGDWWKGPLICSGTGWKSCMGSGSREGKQKERQACMRVCVCVFWGYAWKCGGPHEPLQNIHPFPLPALTVLSRPGTSQLFCVCVLFTVQASNGFIKLPKERKCCPCSDFPLKWSNRIAFYFV